MKMVKDIIKPVNVNDINIKKFELFTEWTALYKEIIVKNKKKQKFIVYLISSPNSNNTKETANIVDLISSALNIPVNKKHSWYINIIADIITKNANRLARMAKSEMSGRYFNDNDDKQHKILTNIKVKEFTFTMQTMATVIINDNMELVSYAICSHNDVHLYKSRKGLQIALKRMSKAVHIKNRIKQGLLNLHLTDNDTKILIKGVIDKEKNIGMINNYN